jgi:hypothetical protein
MIIIETFNGSFIHLSEQIKDNYSMISDISSAVTVAGVVKQARGEK